MERSYTSWAEAFTIFAKYNKSEYGEVSAEHDVLYAGPKPEDVTQEDKERLEVLGWNVEETYECFYKFV